MLKWIALILMTLDHIGYYLHAHIPVPLYYILRIVGRGAFPVFAFYIVKGFARTSNPGKYLLRMAIWAVISSISINLSNVYFANKGSLLDTSWTNVMVLYTFAILMLCGFDLAMRSYHDMIASMTLISDPPGEIKDTRYDVKVNIGGISLSPRIGILLGVLSIIVSFWSVHTLNADYGIYGLLTILFIHIFYSKDDNKVDLPNLFLSLVILNAGYIALQAFSGEKIIYSVMQSACLLIIPAFNMFPDGDKKPSFLSKCFFYIYYPAHIVLLIYISSICDKIIT